MTIEEVAVIVFGAFAGYWVVSKLFFRSPPAKQNLTSGTGIVLATTQTPWHETLQVSADASAPEIRDAYRRLIAQYHPDKVATLGQELKDLAERKSRDITVAYREALLARGETP
jgi:DnaJ domain